jgi:DNA polymerase-3 subunit delta'
VVAALLIEKDGIAPDLAMEVALAAQSHIGIARRLAKDPHARARRDQVLALATEVRGVGDAVLAAADLVAVADEDATAATEERNAREKAELLTMLGAESGTLPPALRAQVRELEEDQKRRATRHKRDVLDRAVTDLMSLYRDVAVAQVGATVTLLNVAHEGRIHELAARTTLTDTMRCLDALATARVRLGANVQPLLAIEAMISALRPGAAPVS